MIVFKWIGLVSVGLYLIALAVVYFSQRGFMYFPPTEPIPNWFLSEHDVTVLPIFVEGVGDINSIYSPPPTQHAPVILFVHGNGSVAHQYTTHFEVFETWGVGYLAVEYPGYGGNPGKPNEKDIHRTALANYDMLISKGIKPGEIIIYGDSLGAACAVHVASQRDAAGLILSAPFLSMLAMAKKQMPWFPTSLLLKDKYRSDKKILLVEEPLLVLHGDADELIPYTQGKALFELHQSAKQFILIKGGQHYMWDTEMPRHIQAAIERFTN